MSPIRISPKLDKTKYAPVAKGGIQKQLENSGRLPPVALRITPIDGSPPVSLDRFLTYQFQSSILIPVDTFSFTFVAPDDPRPLNARIKEGDIVTLFANGVPLSTGIVDQTDVETDNQFGERGSITGRDLMGQLEDQDAVNLDSSPIWGNRMTLPQGIGKLIENTRIQGLILKGRTPKNGYLLATEPGESKLAALQRFLEPLNCLAWMAPAGKICVGKPDMKQKARGTLICDKAKRNSNVLSIKCVRSSTTIPNIILPIWSGQEAVRTV